LEKVPSISQRRLKKLNQNNSSVYLPVFDRIYQKDGQLIGVQEKSGKLFLIEDRKEK